jgi:transcriptional repressor NrdR
VEEVILLDLVIVKRDGQREAYDREKMIRGVKRALEKRPYTDASFRKLLHEIERDIQREQTNELTSHDLGEIVMRHLKTFDGVAYIRFASVYRQFEDVETFKRELEEMTRRKRSLDDEKQDKS